jgi:hypothetical protein
MITFVSPFILVMKDYYEIFEQIKNNADMDILKIIELISLPFFFLGVFIYFDRRFRQIRKDLQSQSETLRDDAHEIDMYLSTLQNRKSKYLYDCIKANKILPEPKKWMTAEEERMHETNSKKRSKLLKEITKRLE